MINAGVAEKVLVYLSFLTISRLIDAHLLCTGDLRPLLPKLGPLNFYAQRV